MLLPALFYAVVLGIFYSALRRYGGPRSLALGLTLGLAFTPNLLFWSQQFYAELSLVYYVMTSLLLLFFYFRDEQKSRLILAGLIAGLATQTKTEGLLLALPALLVLILRAFSTSNQRSAWIALSIYAGLVALVCAPWFIYRRVITPYAENLSVEGGWRVIQNLSLLPSVAATFIEWLSQPGYQNSYFLVFPVTAVLMLVNWKRYAREWSAGYLAIHSLALLTPYVLFLMAEPHWLELVRLGRYLLVFTVACYTLLALIIVDVSSSTAYSPGHWLWLSQRLLILVLFGVLVMFELAADLWPGHLASPPFTTRPFSLLRQVRDEARGLLSLSPTQRLEPFHIAAGHPQYGPLIQVARAVTPSDENVALWVQPGNTDNFLLQRSYYLLYPSKVFILSDPAELALEHLQSKQIGAVIVYGREPKPGELPGQMIFQAGPGYAVARVNLSVESARRAPGFVDAPIQFDGGIQLLGYQVVPPLLDGPTRVILNWQTTRPIANSYTIFVHVFSGDEFVAQHDSLPALGQLPTQFWAPGRVVIDAHPLDLTAEQPAQARFCIGLYDPATLDRLKITLADEYVLDNDTACRPWPVSP